MAEDAAQTALQRLEAGNARFRDWVRQNEPRRAELAAGQNPFAVVLGCSDSRAAPEIVFDAGPGELFVVRVAGNVADTSAIASIEFAVAQLGARLVVVLAHQSCGAVAAAIAGGDAGRNLNHLVGLIAPAVEKCAGDDPDAVTRENARLNAERLTAESEILSRAVKEDGLRIVTAFLPFTTGVVEFD